MTRLDHERIKVLQKRATHLNRRITEAAKLGRDLSYDKAERQALLWAIAKLEAP